MALALEIAGGLILASIIMTVLMILLSFFIS